MQLDATVKADKALDTGESPLTFLAERVGLTRQRIDQIIRNVREKDTLKMVDAYFLLTLIPCSNI